jgi:hypothetical protein
MLRQSCYQPGFDRISRQIDPAPTAPAAWRIASMLPAIRDAWREALAAHRRYEHLRSRGIGHDPAIKKALGVRTAQGGKASSCCGRGFTDPVAPPPRLQEAARIGNLTYVS